MGKLRNKETGKWRNGEIEKLRHAKIGKYGLLSGIKRKPKGLKANSSIGESSMNYGRKSWLTTRSNVG
jgi:hypothetical protein